MSTDYDVARMTAPERRDRLHELILNARDIAHRAVAEHVWADQKIHAATAVLFSGGNDSTVMAHLFQHTADVAIHANTTIGIEDTRQFVRDSCAGWGLKLLEVFPGEGNTYEDMVLAHGFPGPGHHFKAYQRLKERGLRAARRELVPNGRTHRVVYLAGRRRDESNRRANVPELERVDSVVFGSPMAHWTKADLNTYRLEYQDCPSNQAADLLHMSGECLCGSFAKSGELAEIEMWYPGVVAYIRRLEAMIAHRTDIPEYRKKWGWGGDRKVLDASRALVKASKTGPLCSSCDARFTA